MYNTLGYTRISRDEDKENYSSIINQKKLIRDYAGSHGLKLVDIYEDDNVSGYVFSRPGLNRILEEINKKDSDIDVIIAKDFSRIGRHNALTLLFIEQIKTLGKRLILIEEGSGGYDSSRDDDDIIGIKTWYNERYVKDISRKIKSNFRKMQQDGELLIRPYFGYKLDPLDRKQLVVDEETACIVKEIFALFLDGNGYRKIAGALNGKKYVTPSRSICERYTDEGKTFRNRVSDVWTSTHVSRILKNDIYIGTLRLGKTKKLGIKTRSIKTGKDEHYVFENRHEAIISKEDFYAVQEMIEKHKVYNFRGTGAVDRSRNVFSGFLFCGDCGLYMIARNIKGKPKHYVCGNYHRLGSKYCSSHYVREEELAIHFKNHLMFLKTKLLAFIKTLNKDIEKKLLKGSNYDTMLARLNSRLNTLNAEYKELISQKVRDILKNKDFRDTIEENYKELENEKLGRIRSVTQQIESIVNSQDAFANFEAKTQNAIAVFDSIIKEEKLSRLNMELILDRILIGKNDIRFVLKSDIDSLCRHETDFDRGIQIL